MIFLIVKYLHQQQLRPLELSTIMVPAAQLINVTTLIFTSKSVPRLRTYATQSRDLTIVIASARVANATHIYT